jgi:hypothetical protein
LNGFWEPEAETASGRWWYWNSDTEYTLYWDANCDSAGILPNTWIFDSEVPSVTALSDLDGELSGTSLISADSLLHHNY